MHLSATQLSRRFGAIHALAGVSLDVAAGEVVGLIGPNGAGKSTLLDCVAGVSPPDSGEIRIDGAALEAQERRQRLAYLPDGIAPWRSQRVETVLDFAARVFGRLPDDVAPVAAESARADLPDWRPSLGAELGLNAFAHQRIGELSKGQRKRTLVAFALITGRPLILIDEPFDGLDPRQARALADVLRREAAVGRGVLISVHAMSQAVRTCHRLVLLQDGRVIAQGTERELRERAGVTGGDFDEVFLALA